MCSHKETNGDQECPPKRPVRSRFSAEKVKKQPSQPKRQAQRHYQQDLLGDKRGRSQRHIPSRCPNVAHQLKKRPMVLDVPHEVWKENQQSESASGKQPRREKEFTLRRKQQTRQQGQRKHSNRIF